MNYTGYFLIILLLCSLASCRRELQKEQSDFFLKIPELNNIGITCSKRIGAEFYVMFSRDSTQLSDNVDYLKYRTGDMSKVNLVFDPQNKNDIYIRETEYLKETHSVNFNLQVMKKSEFDSLFFEPLVKTDPLVLKYPFIFVGMFPSTYGIYIRKHEPVFKWIKEGDIHGGW